MNTLMCEQFIKVRSLKFPSKPKTNFSGYTEPTRTIRSTLASELELWLSMLLGDEVICESGLLMQFLTDETFLDAPNKTVNSIHLRSRSEMIQGKIMNAMKGAGSVVKTVAASAGIFHSILLNYR